MKQFTQGGAYTGLTKGFALPTILIASVVMIIVLLAAVQTIVVSRLSVEEQYYNRLASEAAESGLVTAKECIRADSSYAVSWSASRPLETGDNCSGEAIAGAGQTVVASVSPIKIETSYSVSYPTDPSQNPVLIESVGTVELKRKSDDSVWKSFTASKKMSMSRGTQIAQQVASGSSVNCGIFDQETWCWGLNDVGQLGRGTTGGVELEPARVVREEGGLLGKKDKLVAVGGGLVCVVTMDNKVFCSGANSYYQMGTGVITGGGNFISNKPYPVDMSAIPSGATITDMAAGRNFTCLIADGSVYCWGRNLYGNLGDGTTSSRVQITNKVVNIGNGSLYGPASKIATTWGADHACAIAGSPGRVYCWGRNTRGQLGNGSTVATSASPVAVTTATGVMANKNIIDIGVAGGGNQGDNPSYSDSCITPQPSESATAGACGTSINNIWQYMRANSCAVAQTGEAYCWGSNNQGQLGQRTTQTPGSSVPYFASTTPVRVGGATPLANITQVALSYGTVCTMTGSGAPTDYYCWGSNSNGALGRGVDGTTLTYSPVPQSPQLLPGALQGKVITKISGGVNRQCAIASGFSYCWGLNNSGQIGDGTTVNRNTPTESKILRQFDEEPTFY